MKNNYPGMVIGAILGILVFGIFLGSTIDRALVGIPDIPIGPGASLSWAAVIGIIVGVYLGNKMKK